MNMTVPVTMMNENSTLIQKFGQSCPDHFDLQLDLGFRFSLFGVRCSLSAVLR
jgi:hypothetical protein